MNFKQKSHVITNEQVALCEHQLYLVYFMHLIPMYFQIRGVGSTAALQWTCKSRFNLEQGVGLECKQGSEKTAGKRSSEEPAHPSPTVLSWSRKGLSQYVCLCYGPMCVLCNSYCLHLHPICFTPRSSILKRSICSS